MHQGIGGAICVRGVDVDGECLPGFEVFVVDIDPDRTQAVSARFRSRAETLRVSLVRVSNPDEASAQSLCSVGDPGRRPALLLCDAGFGIHCRDLRDERHGRVGRLACLLAAQGLDPVGVALPRFGGRVVGVGRVGGPGVGHQSCQVPVSDGAENLVPGYRVGVLRRGVPGQLDSGGIAAVEHRLGAQAAGGQVLGIMGTCTWVWLDHWLFSSPRRALTR